MDSWAIAGHQRQTPNGAAGVRIHSYKTMCSNFKDVAWRKAAHGWASHPVCDLLSLPRTRLVSQRKLPQWLSLSYVKFALWNQMIWQWVRLTEISLAYLVNLFYETGLCPNQRYKLNAVRYFKKGTGLLESYVLPCLPISVEITSTHRITLCVSSHFSGPLNTFCKFIKLIQDQVKTMAMG